MISWFNNGIVQMTITLYITIFYPNVHIYLVVASTIFSPRLLLACTLLLLGKFTQIGLFHLLYALHSLSMVWCMHACLLIFLQIFPIMNIQRVYNLLYHRIFQRWRFFKEICSILFWSIANLSKMHMQNHSVLTDICNQ